MLQVVSRPTVGVERSDARDVDWPNMLEGTRALGHDAVRAYWLAQFDVIDPHVEPVSFRDENGAIGFLIQLVPGAG